MSRNVLRYHRTEGLGITRCRGSRGDWCRATTKIANGYQNAAFVVVKHLPVPRLTYTVS